MGTMWLLVGMLMMGPAMAEQEEVFKLLDVSQEDADSMIQSSIGYGFFAYPWACRQMPMGKRPAIVEAVGRYAKHYSESKAFLAWYEEYRNEMKPQSPPEPKPMATLRREQAAEAKKALAELERQMNESTGEIKEALKMALEQAKATMGQMQSGDPAQDAMADEGARMAYETERRQYELNLAAWEKEFPAQNPRPLIAKRLKQLLEETRDVDFNAKTVGEGWKTFAKPEYEAKSRNWKLAFRAGKKTVEAARTFAQKWLDELE